MGHDSETEGIEVKKTSMTSTYCAADASGRPCSIEYLDRANAVLAANALGLHYVRETKTSIIETTTKANGK